jgi:hypothetical protein
MVDFQACHCGSLKGIGPGMYAVAFARPENRLYLLKDPRFGSVSTDHFDLQRKKVTRSLSNVLTARLGYL